MKMREVNPIFEAITRRLESTGCVYDSWGCYDLRWFKEYPFKGCWSAMCQGFFFQGRIFIVPGSAKGTWTIATDEILENKQQNSYGFYNHEKLKLDVPVKEAIETLDKWIERGDWTDEEYEERAHEVGMQRLKEIEEMSEEEFDKMAEEAVLKSYKKIKELGLK